MGKVAFEYWVDYTNIYISIQITFYHKFSMQCILGLLSSLRRHKILLFK